MSGKFAMYGALLAWGGWGLASRFAVAKAHPYTVQWLIAVPQIVTLPLWIFLARQNVPDTKPDISTMIWAFLTCGLTMLATLLYNMAMKTESPSTVIAVTSAYPMISLLFFVMLDVERLSWTQAAGCLFIVLGAVLVQIK